MVTAQQPIDLINAPPHYTAGKVEFLDALEASMTDEAYRGFLKGQIMKYLWRAEKKHVSPLNDLDKAAFYLARLRAAYAE